jgi:redox-sensitive bicupin YhaK (pirin superfamily)
MSQSPSLLPDSYAIELSCGTTVTITPTGLATYTYVYDGSLHVSDLSELMTQASLVMTRRLAERGYDDTDH